MDQNLEHRARAQCAADLSLAALLPQERATAVERYWVVVAVEIAGADAFSNGTPLPRDFREREHEFQRLRGR